MSNLDLAREKLVLILDDDQDLREGLRWMFETADIPTRGFANFEQFKSAQEGLRQLNWALCLLLDLRMPDFSGLEVFQWLRTQGDSLERMPVIFLTGHGDISTAVEAVKNGAFDFYEKPATDDRLLLRVGQALKKSADHLSNQEVAQQWSNRIKRLSPREREVMVRVAKGTLNKVIAQELDISMRTVEVHRASVFDKLNVGSAAELATLLGRLGSEFGFAQLTDLG